MYKLKELTNGNKFLELNGRTVAIISECDHNLMTQIIEKLNAKEKDYGETIADIRGARYGGVINTRRK